MATSFSELEAGMVLSDLLAVSLGQKPAASGTIRRRARRSFLAFVRRADVQGVLITFGVPEGQHVAWYASRHTWGLEALCWLAAGGSALGHFHLHWVQGLLYGYSPEAIQSYLIRQAGSSSSSRIPFVGAGRKPLAPRQRDRLLPAAIATVNA